MELHALVESSPFGVVVFDDDGVPVQWNDHAVQLFGIADDVPAWFASLRADATLSVALQASDSTVDIGPRRVTVVSRVAAANAHRIAIARELGSETHEESVALLVAAMAPHTSPRVAITPRRGRVLIVDDNLLILRFATRLLQRDHDVSALGDPREALRTIAKGARYDAIVCDVVMPQKTGMDLFAELTVLAPDQAARIVFMTGLDTEAVRTFLAEVPNPRLEKPFPAAQLRDLVNQRIAADDDPDES